MYIQNGTGRRKRSVLIFFFLLNLRSVCVAGLFLRVWGRVYTSLRFNAQQHGPLTFFLFISFYWFFLLCVFSLFSWLQTVAYWRRLNSGTAVIYLKSYSVHLTHPLTHWYRTRLTFFIIFHFVSTFCQKFFLWIFKKHKHLWKYNMGS